MNQHEVANKWREKRKNITLLRRDISTLGDVFYNLDDVENAIEEYQEIERSDFDSQEEYQEERDVAWEAILDEIDCLENLDLNDIEESD